MWSKPVCTNRKSASAERCLRAVGATRAMGIPVMRRSKHARQGVFSHQGLRKASAANPANTGLAGSAGMGADVAVWRTIYRPSYWSLVSLPTLQEVEHIQAPHDFRPEWG